MELVLRTFLSYILLRGEVWGMNSDQFERLLRWHGIRVLPQRSGSGHKDLFNPANGRWSVLPSHGGRKQLGIGLIRKIERDLGLR